MMLSLRSHKECPFSSLVIYVVFLLLTTQSVVAHAANISIWGAETMQRNLVLSDTLVVEGTGSIITTSETAVVVHGATSVTNLGVIASDIDGIEVTDDATISENIVNSGAITADGRGIYLKDGASILGGITNSGVISGNVGVVVEAGSSLSNGITNSGVIVGTSGTAIDFSGVDGGRLILQPGSRIEGAIAFSSGSGNEITIEDGANSGATYSYTGNLESLNIVGEGVVVHDSTTIAVVSHSGFDAVGDNTFYSSVGIANVISQRLTTARLDNASPSQIQLANTATIVSDVDDGWLGYSNASKEFWIEGFGSYQERSAYKSVEAVDNRTSGVVVGVDVPVSDMRIGGFIGGVSGSTHIGNTITTHQIDSSGVFGGGYISLNHAPYSVDISLTAGMNENDSARYVNAVSGQEIAAASYDNVFIAPTVSVGRGFELFNMPLVSSLTVRYTGQWVDSYTETGLTTANLTVDDRFLHTASSRIQLETAHKGGDVAGGMLRVNSRVGIDAYRVLGDKDVDVTVLGQNISFESKGRDYNADGFIGLNVSYDWDDTMNIYADVEATGSISDTLVDNMGGSGKAGIKVKF